jgi:TnpA family transposase
MGRYEDNFVEEGRDIEFEEAKISSADDSDFQRRRINRRDAARAAVESLTNEEVQGKKNQIWSDSK